MIFMELRLYLSNKNLAPFIQKDNLQKLATITVHVKKVYLRMVSLVFPMKINFSRRQYTIVENIAIIIHFVVKIDLQSLDSLDFRFMWTTFFKLELARSFYTLLCCSSCSSCSLLTQIFKIYQNLLHF